MQLTRRSRLATALLALISVLFMQLAVAAYACPSLQAVQAVSAAHADMAGCEGVVDVEQPSLCHAHSQVGNHSLDKPAPPDIPPSVAVVLVPLVQDVDTAYQARIPRAEAAWLMRDSAPPLSVRNCCFRL